MTFLQSFKVLISNFTNVWKVLLYRFLVLVLTASIAVGLALPTLSYIFNLIVDTGFFDNILKFVGELLAGTIEVSQFGSIFQDNLLAIGKILVDNLSKLFLTYIYLLLCLCISRFFNCISDYALCDVVNCKMESFAKVSFMGAIFRNFGRAVKFSLVKILFTIPFDIIITVIGVLLFVFLLSPLGIFMPFVVMLTVCLLIAFRMTIFSGYLPVVVLENCSIFQGLKKGIKASFSQFWTTFSSWLCVIFLVFAIGILFTICTFGVAFFIILPSTMVFFVSFYLVLYYGNKQKRFYIDNQTIVTPDSAYEKELQMANNIKSQIKNNEIKEKEKNANN